MFRLIKREPTLWKEGDASEIWVPPVHGHRTSGV